MKNKAESTVAQILKYIFYKKGKIKSMRTFTRKKEELRALHNTKLHKLCFNLDAKHGFYWCV